MIATGGGPARASTASDRNRFTVASMSDIPHEATPFPEKLRAWLGKAVEAGASDLHLIAGYPPVLRLHGDLTELREPPLAAEVTSAMLWAVCTPDARARLQAQKNVDFSFDLEITG